MNNNNQDPNDDVTNVTTSAEIIVNLESLIKNHMARVGKIKNEMKQNRQMFDDIFTNDATFKLHADKVKEANKLKQATKAQIMKQPNVFDLSNKLKNLRNEKRGLETALSDYLKEYARLSGSTQIEDENGEIMEIVYVAKLVRKPTSVRS